MILFELFQREDHPVYQELEIANGNRHYGFLRSIVSASLKAQRPFLSQHIIKALNFHAITCLHVNAGEYRPCPVTAGDLNPPASYRVPALMDDFVNDVNRNWSLDGVVLASYVLWRLNYIHPFINGNGRTARAACYFVLCVKAGGWLPGETILPELLCQRRDEYVEALRKIDQSVIKGEAELDMSPLHALLSELLKEQLRDVAEEPPADKAEEQADDKPAPPPDPRPEEPGA